MADLLLVAVPQTMVELRGAVRDCAHSEQSVLQFRIAHLLAERARTTGELAVATGTTPAAVSKVIAALDRTGWIARQHDPADRRYVAIALTPAGRVQTEAMCCAARSDVSQRLKALSTSERGELAKGLDILVRHFAPQPTEKQKVRANSPANL